MSKNLTTSGVARQNVLNNPYALQEIQKAVGLERVLFENEYRLPKNNWPGFSKFRSAPLTNVWQITMQNWQKRLRSTLR